MHAGVYEDTIVALATPPGRGALALIRLSGPDSIRALRALSPGARDFVPEPGRQHLLKLRDPTTGALIDEALVVCNFGPRSFTGEDTVEISTHGGVVTPRLLLAALEALGIRGALPGEFTRRAILNGKIDLLQAEAIADLIDADSTRMHRAAIHQVEGALSARISSLREELLRAEAMIAYDIDFPEEDEPAAPLSAVLAQVDQVLGRIDSLLATLPHGERLRGGALVVLAGYPNSGKSSLFNALLGVERAIVTDIPGTTRDAIEAGTTIEGFPFRLADTAGLRSTLDPVEKLGIEVAQNYIAAADLVLFCTEASGELEAGEREFLARLDPAHVLIAATKRDLSPAPEDAGAPAHEGSRSIPISVRTGEGLDQLRTALVQLAFRIDMPADPGEPIITRERHGRALARAASELRTFRNEFAAGLPPELAATHLRSATAALDALIGLTTEADVLDAVFQGFCVGK